MPFNGYAPVENHVYAAAHGLKERGHKVTAVALQGSQLGKGIKLIPAEDTNEEKVFNTFKEKLKNFDCILDFSNLKHSYLYKHDEEKELKIMGCCYPAQAQGYQTPPPLPFPNFVVTSEAMGQAVSAKLGVSYRVVHYPWLPFENSSIEANPRERMLYLGRLIKEKGVQLAVDISSKLRIGLDIVGEDVNVPDQRFVIELLRRADGRLIKPYGRVNEQLKHQLLSKAKCMVLPYLGDHVAWTCLPILEALSHGTPVIAMNKGCVMEYVKNGVNGFGVSRLEELAEAAKKVEEISPDACFETVKEFSLESAIDKYEALINQVVNGDEW